MGVNHSDRIQSAVLSGDAARSSLIASWQRSAVLHHLHPADRGRPRRVTAGELALARERLGPLVHFAGATLDRLYSAVGRVGCCVLLADGEGVPVERRGAVSDDRTFRDWGLWTGTVWSEQAEGTNGIGTCLVERRLVTIHRDQHFFSRNTLLSCTTAPIFDHTGQIAAVLDVSSCRADLTEAFARLIQVAVGDAARHIETETFRQFFSGARFLLAPTDDGSQAALLAVDKDDVVIGVSNAARLALGLSPEEAARPRPAAHYLGTAEAGGGALDDAERGALQRALTASNGNVAGAARRLKISRATMHRKLARHGLSRPGR